MYKLLRPLLFLLDAELSHRLVLGLLRVMYFIPGSSVLFRALFTRTDRALEIEAMGLYFPNPVGLAAGMDKNARCIRPLMGCGFGWLELGTVTPRPQPGNTSKRLFRIPKHGALINRMGFPSTGVNVFVQNLRRKPKPGIIGVNIGKNKSTPNSQAVDDYLTAFRAVYACADYVAVNISSPNTPQLRELQDKENLGGLLSALKNEQIMLGQTRRIYVPIALKISPDLGEEEITTIAEMVLEHKIDAVIATNTTIDRPDLEKELLAQEAGGLSGRPLKEKSTAVIRRLYNHLQGEVPIIGVGGIENANDAWEKIVAGADLIQVYTGFVYHGPGLVRDICAGLLKRVHASGHDTLAEAVAEARTGVHLMR